MTKSSPSRACAGSASSRMWRGGSKRRTRWYARALPDAAAVLQGFRRLAPRSRGHQRRVRVDQRQALLLRGLELSDFDKTRGVLVRHDLAKLVAWCADLEFCDGQLIACAQFPPQGVSRKADRAFEAVRKGELVAASAGFSALERRIGADGVTEVTRWALREWSLTKVGGNPACRVLSVGGQERGLGMILASRAGRDYLEVETPAHYVAALREYERLKRVGGLGVNGGFPTRHVSERRGWRPRAGLPGPARVPGRAAFS